MVVLHLKALLETREHPQSTTILEKGMLIGLGNKEGGLSSTHESEPISF